MKILVVDDVDSNLEIIEAFFQSSHHQLFLAKNGRQAIQIINSQPLDLILLDLRMPEVDGYQVATYVKQNPLTHKIPTIIMTASVFDLETKPILENLCEGFLNKPIRRSQLVDLFKRILPIHVLPKITDQIEENLATSSIFISPQLIQLLESEKDNYVIICQRMVHRDIRAFAQRLQQWSIDYQCSLLAEYATLLMLQLDNFDVENLMETIYQFPSLKEKLNAQVESR